MFFAKKAEQPVDRVAAFRDAIGRVVAESDLHAKTMSEILSAKADVLRAQSVMTMPVASASSSIDGERIQAMLSRQTRSEKPTPAKARPVLRSNDAADIQEFLRACERH